jgi:uncharacterized membrane protein YeaQ/YmgE (transglycosylase-associated protein family)
MEFAINGTTFSLIEFIVWLLVGAIVGAVAQALVGYSPGGLLLSIVIGLLGAFLGAWLARQLGLPQLLVFRFGDVRFELVWAVLGAVILVGLLSLVRRPYSRRRRIIR